MALAISFGIEEHDLANAQIDRQDDRACAIVVTAILEDHLLKGLKSFLRNTSTEVEGQFFKGYGPLASLRSKIDLGFLLGLFDLECHKRLTQVREVRNRMAHRIKPLSFASEEIRARTERLPTPKEMCLSWRDAVYFFERKKALPKEERDEGATIAKRIAGSFLGRDDTPRQRFILYVQHRIYAFNFATMSKLDQELAFLWQNHL